MYPRVIRTAKLSDLKTLVKKTEFRISWSFRRYKRKFSSKRSVS